MRPLLSSAVRQDALRLVALPLVLVLSGAATTACTAPSPQAASPTPQARSTTGAAAASSPVAELQAALTARLVERVYVVAAATHAIAAADGRVGNPAVDGELAALDATSASVADVLGATYSTARGPLVEALRREDRLLVAHAVARSTEDVAGARAARADLVQAQRQLADVIRRVVPQLDAIEVAARLGANVQAQLATSYEQVDAAADEAAATARLLSAGIAADRELGSPTSDAAELRRDLTASFTEHVLLLAALARELQAPALGVESARRALSKNADELADVLEKRYPAVRGPFLRSWRAHLDRLERYARARAAGSEATVERGLVRGYPGELGRLLAQQVRGLPAQTAVVELEPALDAQLTALAAVPGARPDAPASLRQAVAAVFPVAALLSAAVAEDLQLS